MGQLGDQSGASPLAGLLFEVSRCGKQAPIPRRWEGGPSSRSPAAVGARSPPGTSGDRGLQTPNPRAWGVSLAPSCRSVCSKEGGASWCGPCPRSLWDRWDTTAATCRFPLPRAGAAVAVICAHPRGEEPLTPDKVYLEMQRRFPPSLLPTASRPGDENTGGISRDICYRLQRKSRILEGFPMLPSREHTVTGFFFSSPLTGRVKIPGYAQGVFPDTPRPRPA